MSRVTSAMIIVDWMDDCDILLANVIADPECKPQYFKELDSQVMSEASGGYKHLEFDRIYAAGLNYVSIAYLHDWFMNLPWGDNDDAVLIANCNGEGFHITRNRD